MKREAKLNTLFNQYLREKRIYCFYEMKATTLDRFTFGKIEKHQYDGLQATEKSGLVWKFSDQDQREKPCDGISAPPLPSYLVIHFPGAFYMIRFIDIVDMRERGLLGISRTKCDEIAEYIIET